VVSQEIVLKKVLVVLVALALAGCAAQVGTDKFEAGWNAGKQNEDLTADGAVYTRQMAKWFGQALTQAVAECKDSPNQPLVKKARMTFLLNLDGSVREAMVRPLNARWDCISKSIARKTFPAPPRDAYWTSGDITL
jgi:hypothetical protein